MEDMRVYIESYSEHGRTENVGAWFTLPIDEDEFLEILGVDAYSSDYTIKESDMPFDVDLDRYPTIEDINILFDNVLELPEEIQEEISELKHYFGSIEELCDHADDIILYSHCDDMADVAQYYIEETGALGEIPSYLQNYIDYEAFGRDLYIEGNFLETRHGIFEIMY